MGASWASVDSDVTMSWENLGASGSSKLREKGLGGPRSGRLEGSPAPALSGRSNASNAPFGPYSSPVSSSQKRKTDRRISVNSPSTPSAKPTPPVFPPIPTPGLATTSARMPPTLAGLRPSPRYGFGTPQRPAQTAKHGIAPDSLARSDTGLNARNAFYEPEPSRGSSLLFGREPQSEANTASATPTRQDTSAGAEMSSSERTGARPLVSEPTVVDGQDHEAGEDVVMVDSDDPDNFVMRGRRRGSLRLPSQRTDIGADASMAHGAPPQSTALSGSDGDKTREMDQAQRRSSQTLPPGGFVGFESTEDFPAPSTEPDKQEPAPPPQQTPRPNRPHTQPEPQRLAIPGALFDDDDPEANEHDHVPSLPPAQPKGARRRRAARVSSVATESTDEDDRHAPKTSLRRSSRLSSTGPSPEPLSPQKPEKRPLKKTTRTAADGVGRTARKRKATGE